MSDPPMAAPHPAPPKVTIVVVPRERFSVALRSLDSIFANTEQPFDLVYVDGGSPPAVRDLLRAESERRGFTLVRTESYLWPNRARNIGLAQAETPYVAFVDNDVLVTPGWLSSLVACAEDTGAWVVGPLAFEGELGQREVHNAGGYCRFEGEAGRRRLVQENRYGHRPLDQLPDSTRHLAVDYVEFHCVLVRRSTFDVIGPLDDELRSTREHLDLCLQVARHGGSVWSAWDSLVSYLNPPPVAATDLPFFLLRWSEAWNTRSLRRFVDKYDLDPAYLERAAGMRTRRRVVLPQPPDVVGRWFGSRGRRVTTWALDAAERGVNSTAIAVLARTVEARAGRSPQLHRSALSS